MIAWLIKLVKKIVSKLIFLAVVVSLAFFAWGQFQKTKRSRVFTVTFTNTESLNRGAAVYASGSIVGKVLNISPMVNSEEIAVDILITKNDFPIPSSGTNVEIISSSERGGSKAIELTNIVTKGKGKIKAKPNPSYDYILRTTGEAFQISKDFALDTMKFLGSPTAQQYKKNLENSLNGVVTSLEHGTIKKDLEKQLANLNQKAEEIEANDKGLLSEKDKKALLDQLEATKKTLQSTISVSDLYKDKEKEKFKD